MNENAKTIVGAVRQGAGWSKIWGIVMVICGILAIALPLESSVGIVILLAWLILLAGAAHLIFAFQSRSAGGFLWKVLLATIHGVAGFYMLTHPLLGVRFLTLFLAVFLLFEGVTEIGFYFNIRKTANARWVLIDGIVALVLGLLIWRHWPSTSAWVFGTLVGISLIFSGISRFMLSTAIQKATAAMS
jgi:uncharacterized membrane protein HdeD (DUF308 family)